MKRDESLFLEDIVYDIKKINKYSKGLTKEKLTKDIKIQDAIIRRIEIIGEAVKNVF